MKLWEDFLSEVLPYVENCPNIIAKSHIKNAAIEFCQRTALWKSELSAFDITLDIHTYALNTKVDPEEEVISSIDYAFITEEHGETHLNVTTEDAMKANVKLWRTITGTKPSAIMMLDTENCRLYPIPEETIANSLIVGLILKPAKSAAGIPNWIFEQYYEVISHGAKARLMGMKGRNWYSPEEGVDEQSDFDIGVRDATIRTNKGNSRQNMQVQMRPFA